MMEDVTPWDRAPIALGTLAVVALALSGCLDDPGVACGDGTVCPEGSACKTIVGTTHCATPDQLSACAGGGDGSACPFGAGVTGVCNQGVCLRVGCGDGFLSAGERCDGALIAADESCAANGYYAGTPTCTAACDLDRRPAPAPAASASRTPPRTATATISAARTAPTAAGTAPRA
jgi:hypothetical protein